MFSRIVKTFYLNLRKSYTESKNLISFSKKYKTFQKVDTKKRFDVSKKDLFPCVNDDTTVTYFDAHYIYHPAWAARIVKEINPAVHVDISSTLTFCSILSAFVKTDFYDFRPANLTLSNLDCKSADLTALHFASDSINCLSCMHTIEHIGLGRYGDPIDPEGDIKAINELKRVCAKNGNLLIVMPVGKKKIQFNAHRIYDPFDIINYLEGFKLERFSLITDSAVFIDNADMKMAAQQNYGCGCFWFIKSGDGIG